LADRREKHSGRDERLHGQRIVIRVLRAPLEVVPDLTTRGGARSGTSGYALSVSASPRPPLLADAGYDVIGYVPIEGGRMTQHHR
jgi:hypothetical protein